MKGERHLSTNHKLRLSEKIILFTFSWIPTHHAVKLYIFTFLFLFNYSHTPVACRRPFCFFGRGSGMEILRTPCNIGDVQSILHAKQFLKPPSQFSTLELIYLKHLQFILFYHINYRLQLNDSQ